MRLSFAFAATSRRLFYGRAARAGLRPTDFPRRLLHEGMKVEAEHSADPHVQALIAADHLAEDRRYYAKLKRMEAGACSGFLGVKCEDRKAALSAAAVWCLWDSVRGDYPRSALDSLTVAIGVGSRFSQEAWLQKFQKILERARPAAAAATGPLGRCRERRACFVRISLAELQNASTHVAEAFPLAPNESPAPLIVEGSAGYPAVVDGYHRLAGMLAWAQENEVDPKTITLRVIDATRAAQRVIDAAANPGLVSRAAHEAAIATLQQQAKKGAR